VQAGRPHHNRKQASIVMQASSLQSLAEGQSSVPLGKGDHRGCGTN